MQELVRSIVRKPANRPGNALCPSCLPLASLDSCLEWQGWTRFARLVGMRAPAGLQRGEPEACKGDGCDELSFVIDRGGACEYHLDVSLPLPPSGMAGRGMTEPDSCPEKGTQLNAVLHELERVYVSEGLPEWHLDSFLAVAAALADAGADSGSGSDCADARPSAFDEFRTLPQEGRLTLVDDFAEWFDAARENVKSKQDDRSAGGFEKTVLTRYNLLMRSQRKRVLIMHLMNSSWREGLALAQQRKAEIRAAEAECDAERQTLLLRGAFAHEDEVQRGLELLHAKLKQRVKAAGKGFRKALSTMQDSQRQHLRSLLDTLCHNSPAPSFPAHASPLATPSASMQAGFCRFDEFAVDEGRRVGDGASPSRTREESWLPQARIGPIALWWQIFGRPRPHGEALGAAEGEISRLADRIGWLRMGKENGVGVGVDEVVMAAYVGASQLKRRVDFVIRSGQTIDYCIGTGVRGSGGDSLGARMDSECSGGNGDVDGDPGSGRSAGILTTLGADEGLLALVVPVSVASDGHTIGKGVSGGGKSDDATSSGGTRNLHSGAQGEGGAGKGGAGGIGKQRMTAASLVEGCCSTAELLLPDLPAQLDAIRGHFASHATQRDGDIPGVPTKDGLEDDDTGGSWNGTTKDEEARRVATRWRLEEGDWYVTRHTNLFGAHVVIHLGVEKSPTCQLSAAVISGLHDSLSAVGACGVSGVALPVLLTEAAGEGWPSQVAAIQPAAPRTSSHGAAGASVDGERQGGDGDDIDARKRAASRVASVVRCIWDAARSQAQLSGFHLLVPPPAPSTSSSAMTKVLQCGDESKDMMEAAEASLRAICHAERIQAIHVETPTV